MLSEYEKTDDAMIVFACLLLVSVWLLPVKGKAISEQRGVTQLAKFVAAIVVVLGHQVVFYCKTLPSTFSAEIPSGALCVAFFLFMSGYGLMYGQLKRNERPTLKWLQKRMPKLIVPALTAMVFYLIIAASLGKDIVWMNVVKYGFLSHQNLPYGWYVTKLIVPALTAMVFYLIIAASLGKDIVWMNVVKYGFLSHQNLPYGWYVTEILLLYLTFWLAFRYVRKAYALYAVGVIVFLAMGVMIMKQSPIWYIQGLPCFLMGLYLAHWEVSKSSAISLHIHEGVQVKLFMSAIVVLFFFLSRFALVQTWLPVLDKWRYMYVSFFAEKILFIGVLMYLLMRSPKCNKMLNQGGGYFYEIYLVQGGTLLLCREFIQNDWLFLLIGMIVTVMVAKWINRVNAWILTKL